MTKPLPVLRPLVLVALFPLTVLACLRAFGPAQHAPVVRPAAEARPSGERALDRPAARPECAEATAGAAARATACRALDGPRAPSRAALTPP